jgi:hypothetical protein
MPNLPFFLYHFLFDDNTRLGGQNKEEEGKPGRFYNMLPLRLIG